MTTPNNPRFTDEQLEEIALIQQSQRIGRAPEDHFEEQMPLVNYDDAPDFAEELLFSWVAPERVFRPRLSKDYKRNLILLFVLIALLLIFTNQFYLLVVVLALIFLYYALANIPPKKVRHVITNYGIYTHDRFYPWLNRGKRFWFEQSHNQLQVFVETQLFPYRLIMLVGHERNKVHLEKALSHYLIQQKPAPAQFDNFLTWLQKKFPLE